MTFQRTVRPPLSVIVLPIGLALTGCLTVSGPDCDDETRSLPATAILTSALPAPAPGDSGRAQFVMYEARNADTREPRAREVLWFAGSSLNRAGVTAVHVHEAETARLLFTIPLEPTDAPPYVITQVFTRRPYAGGTNWEELYQLIGTGKTYVDVHTAAHPEGQIRGPLLPDNADWQGFVHVYCS